MNPAELRASAAEWLVAVTIATEVPPKPVKSPHSSVEFTAAMIPKAIRAVAEVIKNRAGRMGFPKTPLGVVLAPRQFSGVMRGVPAAALGHRDIWLDAVVGEWMTEHVSKCLYEWRRVLAGPEVQTVPGVTHYYSPVGMLPPMKAPSWAASMIEVPLAGVAPDYFRWFKS